MELIGLCMGGLKRRLVLYILKISSVYCMENTVKWLVTV